MTRGEATHDKDLTSFILIGHNAIRVRLVTYMVVTSRRGPGGRKDKAELDVGDKLSLEPSSVAKHSVLEGLVTRLDLLGGMKML